MADQAECFFDIVDWGFLVTSPVFGDIVSIGGSSWELATGAGYQDGTIFFECEGVVEDVVAADDVLVALFGKSSFRDERCIL